MLQSCCLFLSLSHPGTWYYTNQKAHFSTSTVVVPVIIIIIFFFCFLLFLFALSVRAFLSLSLSPFFTGYFLRLDAPYVHQPFFFFPLHTYFYTLLSLSFHEWVMVDHKRRSRKNDVGHDMMIRMMLLTSLCSFFPTSYITNTSAYVKG